MKTILLTFSATVAAVTFAAILFLNTILGAFGLAATSIESIQELRASHQIAEKMKKRHAQKKLNISRNLAKKSTRRITTTTLAAATVGTVGVVTIMTGLAVADYCEGKKELQDDENILYDTSVKFDNSQCFDEGMADTEDIYQELKNSSEAAVSNAFTETAEYSGEKWAALKEASKVAYDEAMVYGDENWKVISEASAVAYDETTEYGGEKWEVIRDASAEAFQSAEKAAGDLWDATKSWMKD